MQNLKVDVIYHKSPSDFEMEFNLGSSCLMRVLSDKTNDKKSFVKSLVHAVSRSRVIICCGPLFGADGLVRIVSKAIGTGTNPCDNKTYGINSDEPIDIISGSTPLVTPDGYFGGCIIESGPQTIILLTENKTFRKSIMKNLIHPYMAEISNIPNADYFIPGVTTESEETIEENNEQDTAINQGESYLAEKDDEYDAEEEQQEPQEDLGGEEIPFLMDGDYDGSTEVDIVVPEDTYVDIYTSTKKDSEDDETSTPTQITSQQDEQFLSKPIKDIHDQRLEKRESMRAMDIAITLLGLLLLLSILALVYLLVIRPVSMGVGVGEYIKDIFGIVNNSTLV